MQVNNTVNHEFPTEKQMDTEDDTTMCGTMLIHKKVAGMYNLVCFCLLALFCGVLCGVKHCEE